MRAWFIQAGFLCDGPVIVFQGFIVLLGTLLSKRICQIVVGFGKTLVESKGFSKLFFCLVKFLVHHQHDACVVGLCVPGHLPLDGRTAGSRCQEDKHKSECKR